MKIICKIALLTLAILNLIAQFSHIDLLPGIFIAAVTALVTGLALMGKDFKKITVAFLSIGLGLLGYFDQPVRVWVAATNSMTYVIAILVIMQLFSIPIEAGKYGTAVRHWMTRMFRGEPGLFLFSTVATHIFSSFLLFGTIPVMISLLGETLQHRVTDYGRFVSTAVSRGYALVVFWAPGALNLLLVIQVTGVRWIELVIPGFLLSIIGIIVSYLVEAKGHLAAVPNYQVQDRGCDDASSTVDIKALHIIGVVLSLIALTVLFEKLGWGSAPGRVMLAGVGVLTVWTVAVFGQPTFKPTVTEYWRSGILKAVDLAPLFIAMGILASGIQNSGLLALIQPTLQGVANTLGMGAIIVVPLLLILCAIAGIHPLISIVMFGQVLKSLDLAITPITIALCLGLGGSISYIVSPFAGIVLTLAKFTNYRPTDIAWRWNWIYSVMMFAVGVVFACFWGLIFG